jgi:hypothetical protein
MTNQYKKYTLVKNKEMITSKKRKMKPVEEWWVAGAEWRSRSRLFAPRSQNVFAYDGQDTLGMETQTNT